MITENDYLKAKNIMNKQEFMAMSLPYGLKVLRGDNTTVLKVSGIDIECKSLLFTEKNITTYGSISHSKPILRPLSDLIKPCLDGELIPMVELAKICDSVNGYCKLKQEENISAIRYIDSDGITTVFAYHWETQSFGANSCIDNHFEKFTNVHRQIDMFQKLVEWHFDIAGLIDKDEAIDYSTLKGFVF